MDSTEHSSSRGENAETENEGLGTTTEAKKMEMGTENSYNRGRLLDSKSSEMGPITTDDPDRKSKRGETKQEMGR